MRRDMEFDGGINVEQGKKKRQIGRSRCEG